jgi:hypothetical protein
VIAPLHAVGAALLIGLALGFGSGWSVKSWKTEAEAAKAAKELRDAEDRARAKADQLSGLWAANSEAIRTEAKKREAKLRKELEDARYRCPVPESGRLLLEGAIDQANAARKLGAAVPGTAKAGGANGG